MQHVRIKIVDTPDLAPNYAEQQPPVKAINIRDAVIVRRGTTTGKPTVDLVFEDDKGQQYVALTTGGLLESVAAALAGVKG